MTGKVKNIVQSPTPIKEHQGAGQFQIPLPPSAKKRKATDTSGIIEDGDNDNDKENKDWEKLFHALQAERVTKAEALLYAHIRESEEREKLMRSYNQELENANRLLRATMSNETEQPQREEELQKQVKALQISMALKDATIRAYQQLTGVTLTNVRVPTASESETTSCMDETGTAGKGPNAETNNKKGTLDCICTVQNPETMVKTKFRISSVPTALSGGVQDKMQDHETPTFLRYRPLEIYESLPDFLQEEIEFESTQLPQLLQNVLCGIFPEEDGEAE